VVNPFGSILRLRHPIHSEFPKAALAGWTLESIPLKAQADGHSCGDWAHYF